jgi:hypothetical protein
MYWVEVRMRGRISTSRPKSRTDAIVLLRTSIVVKMLLALGQRTASSSSSCCVCQSLPASTSSRLNAVVAHRHHCRLSPSNPTRTSVSSRHADDFRLRRQPGASSVTTTASATTSRGQRRLIFHQNIRRISSNGGNEGAKTILLAGSATAAAAAAAAAAVAASWWILTGPRASPNHDGAADVAPVRAAPSALVQSVWHHQTATMTKCEDGTPHFNSAATLFQHHMSKERETDDAREDHRHGDDDHDEEEEQQAQQTKEPECFLCRVHRQGPCGSMWKDLEACVLEQEKKNPSSSNSNSNSSNDPCKVCASQFEACWKKHAGLYSLIALEEQSADLHKLRKQYEVLTSDSPLSSSVVKLEWDAWNQFLSSSPAASSDIVKNYRRRISQNGNVRFRGPLWKRFEKYHMTNPLLVRVSARVPRSIRTTPHERVLYAVALDQQNRVLGFVEVGGDSTTTARNETTHDDGSSDNFVNMKIIIVPGLTESVKIQLWTTSSSSHGGATSAPSSPPSPRGTKAAITIRETVSQPVDYGASTNSMLALQNQRTRTEKVKSTAAS